MRLCTLGQDLGASNLRLAAAGVEGRALCFKWGSPVLPKTQQGAGNLPTMGPNSPDLASSLFSWGAFPKASCKGSGRLEA